MFDAPPYQGPPTDHFDGRRFRNREETQHADVGSFLKWTATRKPGPWRRLEVEPGPAPDARFDGLRLTLVNHATTLIQVEGMNWLTDPVWSERVSPVSWIGPRRFRPPGIRFEDLPPIDGILISHNHYDHLDLPTLRKLHERWAPPIITGLGNAALLRAEGMNRVIELDWEHSTECGDAKITAVPARHFSGRGLRDRDRTLWVGFVMKLPSFSIYFAGDTGYGDHFREIRTRHGAPDLALIPIGAYRPRWFMERVHLDPDDAVRAHLQLEARVSVAIHYGTFKLADDGQEEPIEDLQAARVRHGVDPAAFRALEHGVAFDLEEFAPGSTATGDTARG